MDASALDHERDSSPLSDVDKNVVNSQEPSKRQSGRVRRKPELFSSQSYSTATKRKRQSTHGEDDNDASDSAPEDDENEEDQDEDADMSEDEADEEELKERRRAQRKAAKAKNQGKKAKGKHTAKKPKIANGGTTQLAFRPVVNGQRKPKKVRGRASGLVTDEEGLFGMSSIIAPKIRVFTNDHRFQLRFSGVVILRMR